MKHTSGKYWCSLTTVLLLTLISIVAMQATAQQITTFILVRHAEKAAEGGKDPSLSDRGKARAKTIAAMLATAGVTKIFSTPYKRTQDSAGASLQVPVAAGGGDPQPTMSALMKRTAKARSMLCF